MPNRTTELAQKVGKKLTSLEWKLTTAESCTGGGVAYAITAIPGSSAWFERGFVTYSNLSKEKLVGVQQSTLAEFGAVSEETAREMAQGALEQSDAQVSIAITGIAGPDGGSAEKPCGTVWFAWASINRPAYAEKYLLKGDRAAVREQSIEIALKGLLAFIQKTK